MTPHFLVIWRTCECVGSVHTASRPFGLAKKELARTCFESLHRAATGHTVEWVVVGDRLEEDSQRWYAERGCRLVSCAPGNDGSLLECFRQADAVDPKTWIYFCEDDYLHLPSTFAEIETLIHHLPGLLRSQHSSRWRRLMIGDAADRQPVLFLPDYPDRYQSERREPSLLFLTGNRHWREVRNITFSFVLQGAVYHSLAPRLRSAAIGARDKWLGRQLFGRWPGRGPCVGLSPLPGLSTHMHDGVMTPLVDWTQTLAELSTTGRLEA